FAEAFGGAENIAGGKVAGAEAGAKEIGLGAFADAGSAEEDEACGRGAGFGSDGAKGIATLEPGGAVIGSAHKVTFFPEGQRVLCLRFRESCSAGAQASDIVQKPINDIGLPKNAKFGRVLGGNGRVEERHKSCVRRTLDLGIALSLYPIPSYAREKLRPQKTVARRGERPRRQNPVHGGSGPAGPGLRGGAADSGRRLHPAREVCGGAEGGRAAFATPARGSAGAIQSRVQLFVDGRFQPGGGGVGAGDQLRISRFQMAGARPGSRAFAAAPALQGHPGKGAPDAGAERLTARRRSAGSPSRKFKSFP